MMDHSFRELDDLVLHLKGLVLVRKLRERRGADAGELAMYGMEIDRVSVKFKTAETVGPVGEGRSAESQAIVTLERSVQNK